MKYSTDIITFIQLYLSRSSHRRCSVGKEVFLKISQISQENTCSRVSFLIELQAETCSFLKKILWHRCFPLNFAKFLRTPFLQNTSGRLLLCMVYKSRVCFILNSLTTNIPRVFSFSGTAFTDTFCSVYHT